MGTETIILPIFFAMIGFVVWTLVNGWHRRQQVKLMTDFNSRLLDRLGSVKDFADLLQTEAGARLIGPVTAEHGSIGARGRILRSTQTGVVVVAVGLGFLFLGWRFTSDEREAFNILGVIALSLGIGLLLSSGTSYWVAKSLGILEAEDRSGDVQRPTQ